jgi:5-methylthioadenosine/S-adenosylhomocysteine deaminase
VAERFLRKWQGKSPLLTPALSCHAPYSCSPETLACIKDVARKNDALFTIHVSETRDEVSLIRERFGKSPIAHLRDLDILDARTLAIHCNWLDDVEMDILREYDVKVSHNPESNMKLAAGIAPIPKLLRKGITVGLGTDGSASNNDLDLFGEMDMAAKIHKVVEMDSTVMDAKTVLKMATIEAARALGLEKQIGSIETGKNADIILLDMTAPHWIPLFNPYSQLVYSARGSDVVTSIIGGRIVMRDRKLLTVDVPTVSNEVRKIVSAFK